MKSLVKEHPVLGDFLNLIKQREKARGYSAEKMDREIAIFAKEILANKALNEQIKSYLPRLKDNINQIVKRNIGKSLEH